MNQEQKTRAHQPTQSIKITKGEGSNLKVTCEGSLEYIEKRAVDLISKGHRHIGIAILTGLAGKFPNNPVVLTRLSRTFMLINDRQSAMLYADRVVELNPEVSAAWVTWGGAAFLLGKHKEATEALDKAMAINSTDYDSMMDMSTLAIDLNHRLREAEQMVLKAIQLEPLKQEGWITLGGILQTQNRYLESKYAFTRAIEINPDSTTGQLAAMLRSGLEQSNFSRN